MTRWALAFFQFFKEISQITNNYIFNLYKASIAEENELDRLRLPSDLTASTLPQVHEFII
jgi:hypothetical protein